MAEDDAQKRYEKLAAAILDLYITIKLRPQDEVSWLKSSVL
jgi:hypothetical protein